MYLYINECEVLEHLEYLQQLQQLELLQLKQLWIFQLSVKTHHFLEHQLDLSDLL